MVQSRQMEVMETLGEEGRAVELFGLLGDILKDTATLLSLEVKAAIILNVAAAVPAKVRGTTMVVEVAGDIFVTSHPIT